LTANARGKQGKVQAVCTWAEGKSKPHLSADASNNSGGPAAGEKGLSPRTARNNGTGGGGSVQVSALREQQPKSGHSGKRKERGLEKKN